MCLAVLKIKMIGVILLFVTFLLDVYCQDEGESINLDYRVLTPNTWLSGLNDCKDVHNLTMASAEDVRDKNEDYNFTSEIEKYLPVWTYAFEVTLSSGKTFLVQSNDVFTHANVFRCSAQNGRSWTQCCQSVINARTVCNISHLTLDLYEVHPHSIGRYAGKLYLDSTIWINLRNETEFLEESAQWSVRCLLLDESGKLRTSNCNEHHRTLCIRGDTQPVLQYVGQRRIPHYTGSSTGPPITSRRIPHYTGSSTGPPITSRRIPHYTGSNTGPPITSKRIPHYTGSNTGPPITSKRIPHYTSPSTGPPITSSIHHSNNTKSTTVSISANTGPDKSDTGVSISVVIVVCCVAVVLIVIAVVVTIGVMKKRERRRNQERNRTRVKYVREQPNYITPISDEAVGGAYSTVQGNYIGEGNDGYETSNPKRNVYEPFGDRLDEEHSYGTPAQATGRIYQPLEEERVDKQDYETAEKSKELAYDSLEDTKKDTRNKETSDHTTKPAAYEWVH